MEEKLLEKIDEISDQMIEGIKRIVRIDSVEDTPCRKTYGDECIYAEITDKTENMLYRAKWFRRSDHFMGNVSSSWK